MLKLVKKAAKVKLDLLRHVLVWTILHVPVNSLLEQFKKLNSQGVTAHANERKSNSLESNTLEG